jgi:hypothetical protein
MKLGFYGNRLHSNANGRTMVTSPKIQTIMSHGLQVKTAQKMADPARLELTFPA